ncbi:hypothetical protein TgHK011_006913 [Trichoderma gracile]|nr:hypothetical protein TgHK011_006913 [Trichoderma gracile]
MQFNSLTFIVAALAGLAAAAPAPSVGGKLVCGETKGNVIGLPGFVKRPFDEMSGMLWMGEGGWIGLMAT